MLNYFVFELIGPNLTSTCIHVGPFFDLRNPFLRNTRTIPKRYKRLYPSPACSLPLDGPGTNMFPLDNEDTCLLSVKFPIVQ